ncbi:AMED_5909 family protein [Amycolatopsis sp. NEAU-NG30]|uniref:AMED_5909 family protein n=1 Tax=Amycolatopsis melonis TaxID=3156488 RepID=A0ABV0LHG4_9PSEU
MRLIIKIRPWASKAVADVDRGHHHEALYWAGYEERKAGEISAELHAEEAPAE